MEQWKKNLYVLWVGAFIAQSSFSLVSPFLPKLLQEVGVTSNLEMWSGVAFSVSFVMSAIMSPIWGAMADKYGRKVMIIRSGIGIGLAYIGMAFAVTAWQVIALRAMNGFLSGFIPSSIALVATNTPDERLGSSLGLLQTGNASGTIMGPLLGGVLSHYLGIQGTLLTGGIVLFAASFVVLVGVHEVRKPDRTKRTNILNDFRIAGGNRPLMMMLFTVLLFQASTMILQPVLPIYIEQLATGIDSSLATGVIFSIAGVATVLAAPFWGRRGEQSGFRGVLLLGIAGAGVLCIPQALTNNLYVLGALRFCFGLFLAAMMPASNALIAKAVPGDFRGRAFGISTSFSQTGSVIGPLLGGFIGGMWNIQVVFLVTAAMLLITAWWLKDKEIEAPVAEVALSAADN